MCQRLSVAVRFRRELIEELFDRHLAEVIDETRDQAFEEDEPLADGEGECAVHQVTNGRVVEPFVKRTPRCVDAHVFHAPCI
jgi:hypothetical protein